MEGIFFYAGFAMMLALLRQNKMVGVGEQFEFIMRDESLHLAFGCDLINTIGMENPEIWTADFRARLVENIKTAVELEHAYAKDACPRDARPQRGRHSTSTSAHRRSPARAPRPAEAVQCANPFPWMSEVIDLTKEKNFFETRVTEYQTGGALSWEE